MNWPTRCVLRWERLTHWHRWFAWYPVSDGKITYWLETIERMGEPGWDELCWVYRPLKSKEAS